MKRSSRLATAIHVVVHLAERSGEPSTSEDLAACIGTNPVVVRRTLAGLREAGLVISAAGHGGGWLLAQPAGEITLKDVYAALGERLLFAIDVCGTREDCLVGQAVGGTLDEFLDDAEALLATRLRRITVADLATRVGRLRAAPHSNHAATK